MQNITYTYTIISSDLPAKCMIVEYRAEGYETMTIGMPLPMVGQPIEEIIQAYAPIQLWANSKAVYQEVATGISGTVTPVAKEVTTAPPPEIAFQEVPITEI